MLIGKWEQTNAKGWEIVDGIKQEFENHFSDEFYTFNEDGTGYNDYIHENSENKRDYYNWALQGSEISLTITDKAENYTEYYTIKKLTQTVCEIEYSEPDHYSCATLVKI